MSRWPRPDADALLLIGMVARPHVRLTRDLAMFFLGGFAFAYETLSGGDRPNILYAALALMGIATYLRGMGVADKGPPK